MYKVSVYAHLRLLSVHRDAFFLWHIRTFLQIYMATLSGTVFSEAILVCLMEVVHTWLSQNLFKVRRFPVWEVYDLG